MIIESNDQYITVIQTKQDNVSFNCSAIGEPLPNIYWIYSGDVISNSTKYVITYTEEEENEVTSTLIITEPGPLDTGVYSCNVSNILGYDIAQTTLTVNGKFGYSALQFYLAFLYTQFFQQYYQLKTIISQLIIHQSIYHVQQLVYQYLI